MFRVKKILVGCIVGCLALLANPVLAQCSATAAPDEPPCIEVNSAGNGLNGTQHALELVFPGDGVGGSAYVQDNSPSNDQTFRAEMYLNANNIDMVSGPGGRFIFYAPFGNRTGSQKPAFQIGIKKNAAGLYRIFAWVRDLNSVNPGFIEGLNAFFLPDGTTDTKLTIDWQAATSDVSQDGFIIIYKNDVEAVRLENLNNPFEVDRVQLGHINGAVLSGANGSMLVDEYASFRTLLSP